MSSLFKLKNTNLTPLFEVNAVETISNREGEVYNKLPERFTKI